MLRIFVKSQQLWVFCVCVCAAPFCLGSDVLSIFAPAPAAVVQTDEDGAVVAAAAEHDAHVLDIDFEVLASGVVTTGMLLRVEPAPGVVFTATVQRVGTDVNGVYGLLAPLQGHEMSHLSLSVDQNISLGEVFLPEKGRRYQIRYEPAAAVHVSHGVAEEELDRLPPGPSIVPPLPKEKEGEIVTMSTAESEPAVQADPLEPVTVDFMIVYTPAAASWAASNQGGIDNVINQAMTRAQQALDNSETFITLRLVHSAQVSYTESGNSGTDLSRLQSPTDGHMDVVHDWRDTYGADVVSFFANVSDTGGLGYSLTDGFLPDGFPAYAFNLNRVQQMHSTYTMIHEIGHNMGAGHHYQQNVQTGPQLYDYASGWRWKPSSTWFSSVMAYSGGQYYDEPAPGAGVSSVEVGHFSNPAVSYWGAATGDATYADNARTLREAKHLTAAYRATMVDPPEPPPPSGSDIGFRATALDNRVMLRWDDPRDHGFGTSVVHIRSSTSGYPATTSDGTLVYEGSEQQFLHTSGVTSSTPHYYTIWVSETGSSFVVP